MIPTSETNTATTATRVLFGVKSQLDFLKFNRGESSRFFGISPFLDFNSFLLDAVELFESDGVFYFLTHSPEPRGGRELEITNANDRCMVAANNAGRLLN